MRKLKLTSLGPSTGVVLPKDVLAHLKVAKGVTLFLVETPGGYLIAPYDPDLEEQLELGEELMSGFRQTFRARAS